jgi:preprotein translocase subunit SecG
MITVLLVIHMLLAVTLVGSVLLQRSEGGALGIGGGGGGLMTQRGAGNLLTRITAVLAACFFATSLGLAVVAGHQRVPRSIVDSPAGESAPAPAALAEPAKPQAPIAN